MSREYTEDEVREKFLRHVASTINYWYSVKERKVTDNQPDIADELRWRLNGLAFSILVALDGEAMLPSFEISPSPCPEDKDFHIKEGENYYPEPNTVSISGCLHDNLHHYTRCEYEKE